MDNGIGFITAKPGCNFGLDGDEDDNVIEISCNNGDIFNLRDCLFS